MDALFTLLFFVGMSIFLSGRKKKQQDAARAKQPQRPVSFQNVSAPAAPKKAAETRAKPEKPAPVPVRPLPVQQSGSLAFDGLEGETQKEHSEHEQKIRESERQHLAALEEAQDLYDMNLQQLRNAVIVSEILNKPVSLRKNSRLGC